MPSTEHLAEEEIVASLDNGGAEPEDPGPQGLFSEQALEQLRIDGPNVMPTGSRRSLLRIAWNALTQPRLRGRRPA